MRRVGGRWSQHHGARRSVAWRELDEDPTSGWGEGWRPLAVEGRLSLNTWTGNDGHQRTGLSVSAWRVEVLGRIGKSRPAKAPKHAEELDDALTF